MSVRRTTAHYLSSLVEKMGANKCLMGPRDIGEHLLPATARFVMDGSPHTRYYGRKIFSILLPHPFFDKFLRKYLSPGTFRNIVGILESIKRRVRKIKIVLSHRNFFIFRESETCLQICRRKAFELVDKMLLVDDSHRLDYSLPRTYLLLNHITSI